MIRHRRARLAFFTFLALLAGSRLMADPLSRKFEIDFFRDVPSRNLKGLAARSDGRLLPGPVVSKLDGTLDADLLWCLEPAGDNRWLLGTGPSGKILEVTLDRAAGSFSSTTLAALDETQILALKRLTDGRVLAGTSPTGRLYLLNGDGTVVTQLALPVDSVLDLVLLDEATALVATGNPGKIYRIDLATFAGAGLTPDRVNDDADLATRGVTLFGEIRDRNVRRLLVTGDRVLAGSAPRGNLYAFPRAGGGEGPVILHENRDAEVTDLIAEPNGDVYAAFVFAGSSTESRLTRPAPTPGQGSDRPPPIPEPGTIERFTGRSTLMFFPANGFPETVASRAGSAFYRLGRRDNLVLIAGGEQGELLGYGIAERRGINFAGSDAAQLSTLAPLDASGDAFLLVGNNAPQLVIVDFKASGTRSAETRRLDLGGPTRPGNLRFNRLRDVDPASLTLSLRTSHGTDDVEGWTPWTSASRTSDGAWIAEGLQGRYARLKIEVAADASADLLIDKPTLFHLPQNRRPQLQDFRLLPPGYGIVPRTDSVPLVSMTLGQMLGALRGEGSPVDRGSQAILGSNLVRQPGAQIAFWNVGDPDGDTLAATFSIRREGEDAWTDLAVDSRESFVQFDVSHLVDGLYFTRLVVSEQAPRAEAERLTITYDTDDLMIDRTAPEILEAAVSVTDVGLALTVRGRDGLSLLAGIEAIFNHGVKETVEQPADGILDGREETFVLELPALRVQGATSVEILLYDAVGNSTARRLVIP
jgi:hypothetical protein